MLQSTSTALGQNRKQAQACNIHGYPLHLPRACVYKHIDAVYRRTYKQIIHLWPVTRLARDPIEVRRSIISTRQVQMCSENRVPVDSNLSILFMGAKLHLHPPPTCTHLVHYSQVFLSRRPTIRLHNILWIAYLSYSAELHDSTWTTCTICPRSTNPNAICLNLANQPTLQTDTRVVKTDNWQSWGKLAGSPSHHWLYKNSLYDGFGQHQWEWSGRDNLPFRGIRTRKGIYILCIWY
jgi:hypothetical protein